MKDYYSILECTPMSTRDEIRKNFRRLAQRFHPDKNPDDAYATARFHDIREAYETLTQPAKKEAWLQERWLNQVMNRASGTSLTATPYTILQDLLKYEKSVSAMDQFRMDKWGVLSQAEKLLDDTALEILKTFDDKSVNATIIEVLIRMAVALNWEQSARMAALMRRVSPVAAPAEGLISEFLRAKKEKRRREIITPIFVILATGLICYLIFRAAN